MCSNIRGSDAHRRTGPTRQVSLPSHALQYLPDVVVSNLISKHEIVQLMDEGMTEEEMADLAEAEAICKRFLEWDLEDRTGLDVKAKLKWVLGVQDGQDSSN